MVQFSIPILVPHQASWFYPINEPQLSVKVTDFHDNQNVWLWRSVHITAPSIEVIEKHITETFFAASLDEFTHE